jgi:DNA-binding beta-propeller fold protein YncE
MGNNRIVLLDTTHMPAKLRYVAAYGTAGSAYNQLRFPYGIFVESGDNRIYVADTLNNRIQRLSVVADADQDGMDDLWEYNYYSTLDYRDSADWKEDPDGDGLINIGEYRAGTDPLVRDTNNNGANDSWELACGRDPVGDGFDLLMIRDMEVTAYSLNFNVESGGVYQVQTTTNLVGGIWVDEGDPVNAVSDGVYQWVSPHAVGAKQYYRIRRLN